MINLTQKERFLLEDEKANEEICIKKYNTYSNEANDPQLKQLFKSLAQKEEQHLNSINQLLNGQVPSMNSGGQQASGNQNQQSMQSQQQPQSQSTQTLYNGKTNQSDCDLCTDSLSTEKYVSSTYNTAIFEFTDTNVRQVLNHIQKEEQEHGEQIFNYMESHGMYNVK